MSATLDYYFGLQVFLELLVTAMLMAYMHAPLEPWACSTTRAHIRVLVLITRRVVPSATADVFPFRLIGGMILGTRIVCLTPEPSALTVIG